MKIVIASDHAGLALKKEIIQFLKKNHHEVHDLGCESEDSCDYPDYAALVAGEVSEGKVNRGILVCGTGIGMAVTANKFKGVRAASIFTPALAKASREHNNLNVLCLGGRVLTTIEAQEIVQVFLDTPFEGGRHEKRVEKIRKLEDKNCG